MILKVIHEVYELDILMLESAEGRSYYCSAVRLHIGNAGDIAGIIVFKVTEDQLLHLVISRDSESVFTRASLEPTLITIVHIAY